MLGAVVNAGACACVVSGATPNNHNPSASQQTAASFVQCLTVSFSVTHFLSRFFCTLRFLHSGLMVTFSRAACATWRLRLKIPGNVQPPPPAGREAASAAMDVSPPLLRPECGDAQQAKRCAFSYSSKRTAWHSGIPTFTFILQPGVVCRAFCQRRTVTQALCFCK